MHEGFHPGEQTAGKESEAYRLQIDANGKEKAGRLYELLAERKIPQVNGRTRLLELGVGSGRTFKELADFFSDYRDIDYLGVDRSTLFANLFNTKVGGTSVVADAGILPFADYSMSAINASAVLHEISSYGISTRSGKEYGVKAVESVLHELSRILTSRGVIAYRDVHCPEDVQKEVVYTRPSWTEFIDSFLPQFTASAAEIQPNLVRDVTNTKNMDGRTIIASARLHREIQRHYITFRDYMRRITFPGAGLKVLDEVWVAQDSGVKRHDLALTHEHASWMDPHIVRVYTEQDHAGFRLDSRTYDDLTDALIENYFKYSGREEFADWLKREGSEMYTYATLDELRDAATTARLEEDMASRQLVPRQYYQQYLDRVIVNPEFEGKQLTLYVKL